MNGSLAGDTEIDARKPEALVYEVRPDGNLELVGVEYVVFKTEWDAAHASPPALFGQQLNVVQEPNRYGIPAFSVLCPGTEGHTH